MVQVAVALLFTVAAALGLTVILAMLKNNADAILSALMGEGAFAAAHAPEPGPLPSLTLSHRRVARHAAPRLSPAARTQPLFNRAA